MQSASYGKKPRSGNPDSSDEEDLSAVVNHIQTVQPSKNPPAEESKNAPSSELPMGGSKKEEDSEAKAKLEEKAKKLEEDSDDYTDFEAAGKASVEQVIEEMKTRRRIIDEVRKKNEESKTLKPTKHKAKLVNMDEINPLK